MSATDTLGLIGLTIDDKYVVESCVGEGGFGVVYRATHKLWQKPVAIKCFKTLMDANAQMREKLLKDFIQEGALLSELSARTASIVQARDVGTLTTPSGAWVPYMVLEWLEGQTLEEWQEAHQSQAWALDRAMAILEPVAMALDVAHARNIAHRDIKPANIFLLTETMQALALPAALEKDHVVVKLLDFGIAKVVQSAADQGMTKTQGQLTSFTPSYGAPEQFSRTHGATGPWTDVYALALILGELVAGKYALEGEDFIQLGMSSADPNRRPTPRSLGADCGDAVEAVMAKALAIKTANRYQRAGEFWNALRQATGHAPLRTATTTQDPRASASPPTADRSDGHHAYAATALVQSQPAPGSGGATGTFSPNVAPSSTAPKKFPVALAAIIGIVVVGGAAAAALVLKNNKKTDDTQTATGDSAKSKASSSASVAPAVAAAPKCPDGMVFIDGGQFFMGSDDPKADDDEKPSHNVTLSPYCIDVHEVTVAEYKACSDKGKCKRAASEVWWPDITEKEKKTYSQVCTINDPIAKAQHPINCVDWDQARIYCEANGKKLPTEAEWEFAARGPDGRIYPWGDDAPDARHLNACGTECVDWGKKHGEQLKAMYDGNDGFALTAPVGSFPMGASRYGLLDIVGNVWEWAYDFEGRYDSSAQTDPTGPKDGKERVVRGGAWNGSFPSWVRPSQRYSSTPDVKSHAYGFRCAKSTK